MAPLQFHHSEVRALTRGMLSNYRLIVGISALIAIAMAVAAGITTITPALNSIDAAVALMMAVVFCCATAVFARVKRRYMYLAMTLCVLAAFLALVAVLANALFGSHAARLHTNAQPFVLMYIPVFVVLVYTYVEQELADRLLIGLVGILGSMVFGYMLLHRHHIQDWTGIWLCFGFCTLVPVHTAILVRVHQRIQSSALHLKRLRQFELQRENQRLRKLERIDPLSRGLNELGIREALQEQFRGGDRIRLAVARIKDYERLQRRLNPDEETAFLRRLAEVLSAGLGPGTRWGMNSERQFIFWTTRLSDEEFTAAIDKLRQQLARSLAESNARYELYFGTASSGTELESNPDLAPALLIHDAELALFKAMIGGFVSEAP